jgi:GTPase involved in cell partitioning and DNA repair
VTEDGQVVLLLKGGRGGLGNWNFRTSTNQVTIFSKDGREFASELKSKQEIAEEIIQTARKYIHE